MSDNSQKFHWEQGIKYGLEGIKLLFVLNGASAISILTFVGNSKMTSGKLIISMIFFALGAAVGVVTMASAYAAQLYYGNADQEVLKTPAHVKHWNFALKWHYVTYVLVAVGVLCFLLGMVFASCGLFNARFHA